MNFLPFYRQQKPSKFRYHYRYYDPKKEEMQMRINRAKRKYDPTLEVDPKEVKHRLRGVFHDQSDTISRSGLSSEEYRESLKEKNWKSILYLVLLVVFFIWLYSSIGEQFFRYIGF